MKTVAISLVGLQPSATASALKTWSKHNGLPDRVLLLATQHVKRGGQLQRLKTFLSDYQCDELDIADNLEGKSESPSAVEVVRRELAAMGEPCQVVFCGDPGPKFLVVAIAQTLPADTIFLHADTRHLWAGSWSIDNERWNAFDLENLGMESLLSLYGLEGKASQEKIAPGLQQSLKKHSIRLPTETWQGLEFAGLNVPIFDLAYERGGWLFGLVWIEGQGKDAVGHVRAAERAAFELRGLQPVIAVASSDRLLRDRARTARLQPVDPNRKDDLLMWLKGQVSPPGYEIISDVVQPIQQEGFAGAGGKGPPLALWMGTDAGATLTALFTHQPTKAWVLYDENTNTAKEMMRRLQECKQSLPVGMIIPCRSDLLGRGVMRLLAGEFNEQQKVRFDITAGRSAQGCALARFPKIDLWSLRPNEGYASPLHGSQTQLPLTGPDLRTQVRMEGGKLKTEGKDAIAEVLQKKDFLRILGEFLVEKLGQHPNVTLFPLCSMGLRHELGSLEIRGHDVNVLYNGRTATGNLDPKAGFWFEDLVGACFAAAGADEVKVGVSWAWPTAVWRVRTPEAQYYPGSRRPPDGALDEFKDEADVLARFGNRVFVISCKLSLENKRLDQAAKEIEAVALKNVGRFAVPLLVRCRSLPPALLDARLMAKRGAAFLDLPTVSNTSKLTGLLNTIWNQRSTFGPRNLSQ